MALGVPQIRVLAAKRAVGVQEAGKITSQKLLTILKVHYFNECARPQFTPPGLGLTPDCRLPVVFSLSGGRAGTSRNGGANRRSVPYAR